jgi:hypothetical protein
MATYGRRKGDAMEVARRRRILRAVEDAVLFAATVLLAFWAFGDRSPAWLTPLYVAGALAAAIFVRRMVVWARARKDEG